MTFAGSEQDINLNNCFKLATWCTEYIIFLLYYLHCKTTTNEDYELESLMKIMNWNLMQFDTN